MTSDGPITPSATASTHHHHRHHHHHHHVPRSTGSVRATSQPTPPREYTTTVNLEPLLRSVRQLPRYHLGSTLYAPRVHIPSAGAPPESAKFGYNTTPVPLPRFEGKENCTFTIRVPRFRIDASRREEICARRAVWGTGIYTDDSDPVVAAIHSGFIRGEWPEDVDVSLLDLEISGHHQHAPKSIDGMSNITSKSPVLANGSAKRKSSLQNGEKETDQLQESDQSKLKLPPVPPSDKDLHITLLILPPLERYEPSVMYGLKSRSWGDNHDGMSFKVERIEWVDEGAAKGEERGGVARRKRLKNMIESGRICTALTMQARNNLKLVRLKGGGIPKGPANPAAASTRTATATAPAAAKVVEGVS